MKKTVRNKYNNQHFCGVLPNDDDLLRRSHRQQICDDDCSLRHVYHRRINEKDDRTQANSPTECASRKPLTSMNKSGDDFQQLAENQQFSMHRDHLQQIALTKGKRIQGFLNVRAFHLDLLPPVIPNLDISSNASLAIQNPSNEANQSSQPKVTQSPPADECCPEVSRTQKTPGQCSKVEYADFKPSFCSKMSNDPVVCLDSVTHQDSTIEEMDVDEPSEASCIEQNIFDEHRAENELSAVSNIPKNANHSDPPPESSMEKEPTQKDVIISSDALPTQDFDADERSNSPEMNSEETLTDAPSSNKQTDPSIDPNANRADLLADKLFNYVQQLKIDFSDICQVTNDMQKAFEKSYIIFATIADASKNLREMTKQGVEVTAETVMAEIQGDIKKNQADMKKNESPDVNVEKNDEELKQSEKNDDNHTGDNDCNDNDDNDNDDDINNGDMENRDNSNNSKGKNKSKKTPKTTRGNIRSFVLPPEYDPNDTRWTLMYRENNPELNLVELIPGRNVFINAIKLAHCKQVTKDAKALARMLLVEIFSPTALSVCSFTGARANAFDVSGTNVRPGLDENARMTLLSYVEEHSVSKDWGAFDSQAIINSLRSKIQEIRAKSYKS